MAYFRDAQEVYDTIGKLLVEIAEDDELGPRFRRANTIVQYACTDPDATITVSLQEDRAGAVEFGDTAMKPEVTMRMTADTAHRFWLGEVNVTMAIARGEIKPEGPHGKVVELVPLARPAFARYRAQLEADGRGDLVDV